MASQAADGDEGANRAGISASESNGSVLVREESALPPACPGVRHVRIPRVGIVIADDDVRRRIDRFFHYPMIALALLTLPLLVIDYLYIREANADPNQQPTSDWVWWLTIAGLTVIWLAFLAEFMVKIAVAECRIEYVKRNWLDLIIIVIPALRPLRAAAVARTARVFTLRGVGFKFCRYVFTLIVGLEATDRLLHRLGWKKASGRREPEAMTRHELMAEVKRLRRRNDQWERWHQEEQEFVSQRGGRMYGEPCPTEKGDQESVQG